MSVFDIPVLLLGFGGRRVLGRALLGHSYKNMRVSCEVLIRHGTKYKPISNLNKQDSR